MDWSSPDTWRWAWLVAAVVLTVAEATTAGAFVFLPFAAGATVATVAAFAGAGVAVEWLAFLLASAAASAVLWPLGRRLERRSSAAKVGAGRWAGREGYVLEDIPGGPGGTGLVRLDREQWRAESAVGGPIRRGATVLVTRVDGTRLVVLPLDDPLDGLASSGDPSGDDKERA